MKERESIIKQRYHYATQFAAADKHNLEFMKFAGELAIRYWHNQATREVNLPRNIASYALCSID